MEFSSKLLENAVNEIAQLPGIGKRTALRLALHLIKQPKEHTSHLTQALNDLREHINFCSSCHNLSDVPLCEICSNPARDDSLLCVVEDIRDVIAVENTAQFKGYYHVLGGIISPIDGIGPQDLNLDSLEKKVKAGKIKEIIFALSATMEADTTNFYIYKILAPYDVQTSAIARGIPVGDELEYTDEVTLGRSILKRVPYENSIVNK
ncbi:recombination mediator RecR [Flavobacteriaceae bacterium]|nr:recombination mediator RecR [Flavobacteriaceae bacterium]MDB2313979.1 recombination mediator RecR [Flavobacteriaceae bacterium]RPG66416.1 MAG: recombination protein RecR [Flavobacteriaceae bacterium TMED42]|tara:strand:- start:1018 stop:1638 length:621 start_codon:yes stop_codon:yes gene_type:complete